MSHISHAQQPNAGHASKSIKAIQDKIVWAFSNENPVIVMWMRKIKQYKQS